MFWESIHTLLNFFVFHQITTRDVRKSVLYGRKPKDVLQCVAKQGQGVNMNGVEYKAMLERTAKTVVSCNS